MEVQSNENAALLKLLKTKSRTKTELLKVSSARRRAHQEALDALLAEGKVVRIDRKYFANDPSGSVEQLIHAEAGRLDAYLSSVPELLSRSGKKLRRAVKDNALASVALQRLLEIGQVIEPKYKKQRLYLHSAHLPQQSAQARHSQETSLDVDHDLSLQKVHQAYDSVCGRQLAVRHSTKWRKGALSRAVLPHHLTPFDADGQPRDRRFAIPINVIERNGD